jgi:hypothetical protein
MTDFNVQNRIDGFRFKHRCYKPGEIISVTDAKEVEQLRLCQVVTEIKPAPKPEPTTPQPEQKQDNKPGQKKDFGRK